MIRSALLVLALAAIGQAFAGPCVKVRDGTDGTGPSGGYRCMKFSKLQQQAAAKLQLRLASPYRVVRSQLSRDGWRIDPQWLEELLPEERSKLPVCGHGWDAVCHIQVTNGVESTELIFSGTNQGLPLISVEPVP
jgi:hypothetical protein